VEKLVNPDQNYVQAFFLSSVDTQRSAATLPRPFSGRRC